MSVPFYTTQMGLHKLNGEGGLEWSVNGFDVDNLIHDLEIAAGRISELETALKPFAAKYEFIRRTRPINSNAGMASVDVVLLAHAAAVLQGESA